MKMRKFTDLSIFAFMLLVFAALSIPAQRAPAAFRSITVKSEPGAAVWVDGVLFGRTAKDGTITISTVSAGVHTIRVRADGFSQIEQPLGAAQKGTINITLKKTDDPAELAFQEAERLTLVDREKAVAAYERAIAARPKFPEAFLAMARMQTDMGDLDDALRSINSARKLRPGNAEATAVEGRILKEMGEEQKAIAAFKRAVAEGNGFQPEALTGLGLLYKDRAEFAGGTGEFSEEAANYAESAKYLRSALKQLSGAPDAIVIYQIVGLIYERLQRPDDAIAVYEEFLRIFPSVPEATAVRSFITQLKKTPAQPQ